MLETFEQALDFVHARGLVLISARGAVPSLTEAIVGAPFKGSWWSHPQGRRIFAITQALRASDEVLVCRLLDGKLCLLHRRLWPALVQLADRFTAAQLAQVIEQHGAYGRHHTRSVEFPLWVPAGILAAGHAMDPEQASSDLHACGALRRDLPPTQV